MWLWSSSVLENVDLFIRYCRIVMLSIERSCCNHSLVMVTAVMMITLFDPRHRTYCLFPEPTKIETPAKGELRCSLCFKLKALDLKKKSLYIHWEKRYLCSVFTIFVLRICFPFILPLRLQARLTRWRSCLSESLFDSLRDSVHQI